MEEKLNKEMGSEIKIKKKAAKSRKRSSTVSIAIPVRGRSKSKTKNDDLVPDSAKPPTECLETQESLEDELVNLTYPINRY